MRRVAEIIHIVESEREQFIRDVSNPDIETQRVLWLCGVRKQQYFAMSELLIMTFEYAGSDFAGDMKKMAAHLDEKGHLVKMRRKDVPVEQRATTNWWAPMKRIASLFEEAPAFERENQKSDYIAMLEGSMDASAVVNDISYNDDDWTDDFHF